MLLQQAFSVDESCLEFGLRWLSRYPETPAWLCIQRSHHSLPGSGGELASAANGVSRSSPWVAVELTQSFRRSDQLFVLEVTDGKGCLQAKVGPLACGCHQPGLPLPRRAMPTEFESSLHWDCGLFLGVNAQRLSSRHLQSCRLGDT